MSSLSSLASFDPNHLPKPARSAVAACGVPTDTPAAGYRGHPGRVVPDGMASSAPRTVHSAPQRLQDSQVVAPPDQRYWTRLLCSACQCPIIYILGLPSLVSWKFSCRLLLCRLRCRPYPQVSACFCATQQQFPPVGHSPWRCCSLIRCIMPS